MNSTIDWSQAQDDKRGGLCLGPATNHVKKPNYATETSTQASQVQALGQQPRAEAEMPLMTSRDESCEEVPVLTPS